MEDVEKTIICDTEDVTEDGVIEEISFSVNENIVREHHKVLKNGLIIVSAAAAILVFLAMAINNVLSAAISALLAFIIVRIVVNTSYNAKIKRAIDKLNNSTCTYRLKSECIEYYGYENGELVHFRRIRLADIVTITRSEKLYTFVADGVSYAIDLEAMVKDSIIAARLDEIKAKSSPFGTKKETFSSSREKRGKTDVAAVLCTVLSIICAVVAMILEYGEYTSVLFIALMIAPLAYFILCLTSQARGYKSKKPLTVIVAISAAIILIFGSYMSSFGDYTTVDKAAVELKNEVSDIVGMDIEHTSAYYYNRMFYLDDTRSFIEVENADIYMDFEDGAADFRDALLENPNWISADAEIYTEKYVKYTDNIYCDIILIYNSTTGEYNSEPKTGDYYIACYSADSHCISIYKFSI